MIWTHTDQKTKIPVFFLHQIDDETEIYCVFDFSCTRLSHSIKQFYMCENFNVYLEWITNRDMALKTLQHHRIYSSLCSAEWLTGIPIRIYDCMYSITMQISRINSFDIDRLYKLQYNCCVLNINEFMILLRYRNKLCSPFYRVSLFNVFNQSVLVATP